MDELFNKYPNVEIGISNAFIKNVKNKWFYIRNGGILKRTLVKRLTPVTYNVERDSKLIAGEGWRELKKVSIDFLSYEIRV